MQSQSALQHPSIGRRATADEAQEERSLRQARVSEAWAPVALRLMLAGAFLFHGLPKLYSGPAHTQFMNQLASMSVPAPGFAAWAIGGLEVAGAVFILLGLLSRVSAFLLIIEMIVAAIMVHGAAGFSFIHVTGMGPDGPVFGMPGYEVNMLYISMLLAVLIGGPGKAAITPRDARWWVR